MKIVTLIGTKNKTDFAIYLAHTMNTMKKNVLIVDATTFGHYQQGYFQVDGEYLSTPDVVFHSLRDIDIVCEANDWVDVEKKLRTVNTTTTNYDCILIDIDSTDGLLAEWPSSDLTLYVSDNEKFNLAGDVSLLHRYFDENDTTTLRRVHFESAYKIPADYIETLMKNRPTFEGNSIYFDYDEDELPLRMLMQHEHVIPFNKLNKAYKRVLQELSCELFEGMTIRDVESQTKRSFFGIRPKNEKDKASQQQTIGG
ncbi:hypothetical protein [Lysinibacillus xylanilyticus]|uniref:hypothetical protein n=1 Tax=Lysinibacillus xylanilyticus TaxID=582475 RepID=UPI0037FE1075